MLAALILAAVCTPLPTCGSPLVTPCATPTPTVQGDQPDHARTVGYRVLWKHPEDTAWRASIDLPAFPGDADSDPVWPSVSISWPIQRLVPTTEQNVEVDIVIKAFSASNEESAPSPVVTICMPPVYSGRPAAYQ